MKRYIYILSIFLLLGTSCNSWLDVTPKDTIVENVLFEDPTGYRNALNGIYKQMSGLEMYGKEMSWGFVDVLGQCYSSGDGSIGTDHPYYEVSRYYRYDANSTKAYIQSMWSVTYNSIANCNNVLAKIKDVNPSQFAGGELEKNLIVGEALALRAILHFDMLRLFAPAMIVDDNKTHIPYVDSYPQIVANYKSNKEVLDLVISDLKSAYELVAQFDLLDDTHRRWLTGDFRFQGSNSYGSEAMPGDLFYAYRGYRMNCYAITAMLARVYNYYGKHDLAVIEANKVLDAKYIDEQTFQFAKSTSVLGNSKMSDDLIFTLSSPKQYENYKPYAQYGDDGTLAYFNFELVYTIGDVEYDLFDDAEDYRGKELIYLNENDGYTYYSSKNIAPSAPNDKSKIVEDMLPMIRLSEMYYIIAEAHAANGNFSGAADALDEVRVGRNCTRGALSIGNLEDFKIELLREAKREFICEGQMFFYFKKINQKFDVGRGMPDGSFVLPLPENQTIN